MPFPSSLLHRPVQTLILSFIAWKILLLVTAAGSPGIAYDTSTSLAQRSADSPSRPPIVLVLNYISQQLTRWDAIYFTTIARRGYLYEQEWAFGWGFTQLIRFCTNVVKGIDHGHFVFLESLIGIAIAHASHGLSVLVLYGFTRRIFPDGEATRKLAFVTALLHIISPAGLFLSAPYGESTFALLSFVGYLVFSYGFLREYRPQRSKMSLLSYLDYCWERQPQQVGFLGYWTLSNVPLFALAAPMLGLMMISALSMFRTNSSLATLMAYSAHVDKESPLNQKAEGGASLLRSLAVPQLTLAVLALFCYHVQIITRISSGYPVWYIWLASNLLESGKLRKDSKEGPAWSSIQCTRIVKYMVVYGIV
ncbi:MAG: ER membrane glycoprotein subunit of the GPI transamidase complex-like protein [Claussenomyces sp. TS43310]|nr:MAG: ER membrane glycoprotein subunit of the GPI transamidase complex-like protein [Claussenomyces sp. TS43310]